MKSAIKNVVYLCFAALVYCSFTVYISLNDTVFSRNYHPKIAVEHRKNTHKLDTSVESNEPSNITKSKNQLVPSKKIIYDADAIRRWEMEKFGHYYPSLISSDYNSYNIETLTLLMEQGDLKAIELLAAKYRKSGDIEIAIELYNKAAVIGSTPALLKLGELTTPEHGSSREKLINELSYLRVSTLRGDGSSMTLVKIKLVEYGLQLNINDRREIQEKGSKIYDNLERRRSDFGLPRFDNTVPKYARDYYEKSTFALFSSERWPNPFRPII